MIFFRYTSPVISLLFTALFASLCAPAQSCTTSYGSVLGMSCGLPADRGDNLSGLGPLFAGAVDLSDAWTVRKRVDEVTVFFTATNGHKYVDDLTEQEVSVKDDNKPPAKISAFGHQSDLPLRLGLLIDTSDSVHYRFGFEQQAASRFLHKIVRLK